MANPSSDNYRKSLLFHGSHIALEDMATSKSTLADNEVSAAAGLEA
jgi:hypothetical protein